MERVNSLVRPYSDNTMHAGYHDDSGCPKWEEDIIMQYTGLKDKNGKEIYEGDIISYGEYSGAMFKGSGRVCLHEVFWDNNSSCFTSIEKTNPFGENSLSGSLDSYGSVIGNIYENPELLSEDTPCKTK
jgi:uncharacterized phage protein (TIGR01671 family)